MLYNSRHETASVITEEETVSRNVVHDCDNNPSM